MCQVKPVFGIIGSDRLFPTSSTLNRHYSSDYEYLMKEYLLVLLLLTAPLLCGELRFGPRLGVLTPGDINGVNTHPSAGLYFGAAARFPLSSLISVKFDAGAALDMGGPPGEQLPGYPSYDVHDADYFGMNIALSVNYSLLSLAAGPGYYYLNMDWEQDLTENSRLSI